MTLAQNIAACVCCWLVAQAFVIALVPTAIDLFRKGATGGSSASARHIADRLTGAILLVGGAVFEAGLVVLAVRFVAAMWSPAS